jgi:Flp pilus assembly protein TadG
MTERAMMKGPKMPRETLTGWFLRFRAAQRGVAGIELALATPMLLLMLTGGFDSGRAIYEQNRLASAAQAGVQYAVQSQSNWTNTTAIVAEARADAGDTSNSLSIAASQCTCPTGAALCSASATCTGSTVSGTYVKVTVAESYATLVTYPFMSNPLNLSSQAIIRVQ